MKKRIIAFMSLVLALLIIAGCQVTPADQPTLEPIQASTIKPVETITPGTTSDSKKNDYFQYMPKGKSLDFTYAYAMGVYVADTENNGRIVDSVEAYNQLMDETSHDGLVAPTSKNNRVSSYYNEEFFTDNVLVYVSLYFSSGSIIPEVQAIVSVSDTIYVGYTAEVPEGVITQDMACKVLFISIPREDYNGEVNVKLSDLTDFVAKNKQKD